MQSHDKLVSKISQSSLCSPVYWRDPKVMYGLYLVLHLLDLILLNTFNLYFYKLQEFQHTAVYFSCKSEARVNMLILPECYIKSSGLYSVHILCLRQFAFHNFVMKREHDLLPTQIVFWVILWVTPCSAVILMHRAQFMY